MFLFVENWSNLTELITHIFQHQNVTNLALLPPTAAALTLEGCDLEGKEFRPKKLYERHPLIFAENHPFKYFASI